MSVVYINGRNVADLGLEVEDVGPWLSGLSVQRTTAAMPFGFGSVVSAVETYQPRDYRLRLATGDEWTLEDRESRLATVRETLQGLIELAFEDSERVALCRLEEESVSSWRPEVAFALPHLSASWTLRAYQVARLALEDRVVGFTTTPGAVHVGDFPRAGGILFISGAATDPIVTLRNFRGEVVASMAFQVTLGADEALEVDLYEEVIWLRDGDGRSRADSLLVDGDFFELRPEHRGPSGAWPTIEVSSGSGVLLHRTLWR